MPQLITILVLWYCTGSFLSALGAMLLIMLAAGILVALFDKPEGTL